MADIIFECDEGGTYYASVSVSRTGMEFVAPSSFYCSQVAVKVALGTTYDPINYPFDVIARLTTEPTEDHTFPSVLRSKQVSPSSWAVHPGYLWQIFTFSSPVALTEGVTYCLWLSQSCWVPSWHQFRWNCKSDLGTCPNCHEWIAIYDPPDYDECSDITPHTHDDNYFRIYGGELCEVITEFAVDIQAYQATMRGELISDGGESCEGSFEYGLTDSYGSETSWEAIDIGDFALVANGDLLPATTYHFRARARNSVGTCYGDDLTFTTFGAVYPSEATTRVTSLIHRFSAGTYTLEVLLGEVSSDFALPTYTKEPEDAIPPYEPGPYWRPKPIPPYEPGPYWTTPSIPPYEPGPYWEEFHRLTGPFAELEFAGGLVGGIGTLPGIGKWRQRKWMEEQAEKDRKRRERLKEAKKKQEELLAYEPGPYWKKMKEISPGL